MDGSSIDEAPSPSKPTPKGQIQSSQGGFHALSRPHIVSCAALAGALVPCREPGRRQKRPIPASPAKAPSKRCSTAAPPSSPRARPTRTSWSERTACAPWRSPPSAISTPPSPRWTRRSSSTPPSPTPISCGRRPTTAKKDYDKAIADLDEAIKLDGKHGDYLSAARHRLSRQGRSRPGAGRIQREGQARS